MCAIESKGTREPTYSSYRISKVLYQTVMYKGKSKDSLLRQILNIERKAFHEGLKTEKRSMPLWN